MPTQSLTRLKEILDELIKSDAEMKIDPNLLIGNVYLMKFEAMIGLVWKGIVPKNDLKQEVLNLRWLLDKIDVNLFKKVNK